MPFMPIIAARRAAIVGRLGRATGIIPPRAGVADIADGIAIIPPSAFFTDPPFLSFNSTVGSVVIILTIGLN
jgi:hypothetical protein